MNDVIAGIIGGFTGAFVVYGLEFSVAFYRLMKQVRKPQVPEVNHSEYKT